jgi:hypothetical protein
MEPESKPMTAPDLNSRLRALTRGEHDDLSIGDEAADAFDRMAAEIARLRADLAAARQLEQDSPHAAESLLRAALKKEPTLADVPAPTVSEKETVAAPAPDPAKLREAMGPFDISASIKWASDSQVVVLYAQAAQVRALHQAIAALKEHDNG